jgi:hypothetical protein
MTDEDIKRAYYSGGPLECTQEEIDQWRNVANTAIARAIEEGDVWPIEQALEGIAKSASEARASMVPEAMLEKVAIQIVDHMCKSVLTLEQLARVKSFDVRYVIGKVKDEK